MFSLVLYRLLTELSTVSVDNFDVDFFLISNLFFFKQSDILNRSFKDYEIGVVKK